MINYLKEKIDDLKNNKYQTSVYFIFSILAIIEGVFLTRYFIFVKTLSSNHYVKYGFFHFLFYILSPLLSFILLTGLESYKKVVTRRYAALKALVYVSSINATIIISYLLYKCFFNLILMIPFSAEMTLFLVYLCILVMPFIGVVKTFSYFLNRFIGDKSIEKEFLEFDFCYFLTDLFRDMNLPHIKIGVDSLDGKDIYLYCQDRMTHILCLGPTGGGKSSMTILPQVFQDLKNKAFAISCINKVKEYENKIEKIEEKISSAPIVIKWLLRVRKYNYQKAALKYNNRGKKCNLGISVIEPKGDLIDTIVNMIDKYFPVLKDEVVIIDPLKDDSEKINVMTGETYTAAEIVSSSLNEMQGGAKDFFAIFQSNVCRQIVLLLKYVHGDDCSIEDLNRVLSDNLELKKEVAALEAINRTQHSNRYDGVIRYFKNNTTDKKMAEKFQELTLGLKSILEQLTINPRLNRVMCSTSTVNFDEVINNGKILLINTAMGTFGELGHLFGRFCIMHYEYSCFRRDIKHPENLIPNYTYIDEFPLYRNKRFTEWLTLGRGFRTGAFIAAQGLSGLVVNGNRELRDMVLSCCRNKLIFGGISVEDAKIFADEFGEEYYQEEMEGIKQTDLVQGQISYVKDVRKSWKQKKRFSVSDILYLDDKKIIAKVIKDRKIMPPRLVSVDFLKVKKSDLAFLSKIAGSKISSNETLEILEDPSKDQFIQNTLQAEEDNIASIRASLTEEDKKYIEKFNSAVEQDYIQVDPIEFNPEPDLSIDDNEKPADSILEYSSESLNVEKYIESLDENNIVKEDDSSAPSSNQLEYINLEEILTNELYEQDTGKSTDIDLFTEVIPIDQDSLFTIGDIVEDIPGDNSPDYTITPEYEQERIFDNT